MGYENTYETIHKRKDGSTFHVQASVKPIEMDGKEYYYGSSRNITELVNEKVKSAQALENAKASEEEAIAAQEEAIASQEELYNAQLELVDLNNNLDREVKAATKELNHSLNLISKYIITSKTDLEGNILEISDKFCEVSKYSKEELIGQNHRLVRHPDMPNEVFKDIWETITSGNIWRGKIKNKDKEGNPYWVDSTISPYYDEDGNHVGYFSYRIDITKEEEALELQSNFNKQLQLELNNQLEVIRQKDLELVEQSRLASLGEMIGNISHQWRQPLSVISLSTSSLSFQLEYDQLDKDELSENLQKIEERCSFLTETINSFSKVVNLQNEKTNICIEEEISDSKNIISATLDDLFIKLVDNIDYSQKHLTHAINNDITNVLIKIYQNSIDSLKNKDIENKWIKIYSEQNDEMYSIFIEDNGLGIKEDIKSKIFEPYFTTKFKSEGVGLGLSTSYDIVKNRLGGEIKILNCEDGAIFRIDIPILAL